MNTITRKEIITCLKEQLPYLAEEFGVEKIGLFGSFAQDTASNSSDVDLMVEFNQPIGFRFIELIDYLEQLLNRKVDLLTPAGIQDIRLNHVSESINSTIIYV